MSHIFCQKGNVCGLLRVLRLFSSTVGILLSGSKVAEQDNKLAFSAKPFPIKLSLLQYHVSSLRSGTNFRVDRNWAFPASDVHSLVILNVVIQLERLKIAYLVFGF